MRSGIVAFFLLAAVAVAACESDHEYFDVAVDDAEDEGSGTADPTPTPRTTTARRLRGARLRVRRRVAVEGRSASPARPRAPRGCMSRGSRRRRR